MPAGCTTAGLPALVEWRAAADGCQMDALPAACLVRMASEVASWGGGLASALAQAAALERCSPRTLAQLLAVVSSAGAHLRAPGQHLAIPAEALVERAISEASHLHFDWVLTPFSRQPSGTGERVLSPAFRVAGALRVPVLWEAACCVAFCHALSAVSETAANRAHAA